MTGSLGQGDGRPPLGRCDLLLMEEADVHMTVKGRGIE